MKKIWIILLFSLAALNAQSQKRTYIPGYTGSVQYSMNPVVSLTAYKPTLTTREETLLRLKMESVHRALKSNPELAPPMGAEVLMMTSLPEPQEDQDWLSLVRITLGMSIYPWFEQNDLTDYHCESCVKNINLYFNQPEKIYLRTGLDTLGALKDTNGFMMFPEPRKIGEQNDCPVYDNGIVIIARSGNPLWEAVTVNEYNQALMRYLEFQALKNPKLSIEINTKIAKINDEMATLSEKQKKSPAWIGNKYGAWHESTGPDSRPLVRLNPDYFDNTKVRLSVQLIVLESDLIGSSAKNNPYMVDSQHIYESEKTIKILQKMDFSGLLKFMN